MRHADIFYHQNTERSHYSVLYPKKSFQLCYSTVTNLWRYYSTIVKLNNSFLFTHKWIWLFLSLYFLCFSSPLSFSTTASLSLITSLCHGGHILAWVRHGLLKLTDDGLWFLANDGLLKLDDDGLGFVCVVRWWRCWSGGSIDLVAAVRCVLCFVCFDQC